jgi:hypothetical protein
MSSSASASGTSVATGASLTATTLIETVAMLLFREPSLTRKVNESVPL